MSEKPRASLMAEMDADGGVTTGEMGRGNDIMVLLGHIIQLVAETMLENDIPRPALERLMSKIQSKAIDEAQRILKERKAGDGHVPGNP